MFNEDEVAVQVAAEEQPVSASVLPSFTVTVTIPEEKNYDSHED